MSKKNRVRTDKYGVLLYTIIVLGYIVFGIAALGVTNLRGNADGGWLATYFEGHTNKVVEQASNYGISFASGVASIGVAYFLVKFGHKYSVLISLALLSVAVIVPWLHSDVEGPDPVGFALFIIARLFVGLGGATVIIYIQPIIARYIKNPKTKKLLSSLTPISGIGLTFAFVFFAISPEFSQSLYNNWQLVATCFGLPAVILLILYWIKAEHFEAEQGNEKPVTFKEMLKDKRILILSINYGLWLSISILPIYVAPVILSGLHPSFSGGVATENSYLGYFNWSSIWAIFFTSGMLIASFTVARFNRLNKQRKYFLMLMYGLSIIFYASSFLCGMAGGAAIWGSLVFALLAGIVIFGCQGIIWTIPFELKNQNPQKIGITFAVMRMYGYFILTFTNIFMALLIDPAIVGSKVLPGFDSSGGIHVTSLIFVIVFLVFILVIMPLLLFLPKSHFNLANSSSATEASVSKEKQANLTTKEDDKLAT